ncbi:MAG TPA: MHYT domain-containing protein [Burkholderiales bacterium]|nr:MHYT domain-containing protein [Burkholderiales bacterium]
MPKDFNFGLVFLSYLVAVTASHVTLLLAARVRDPHAVNWKLWVVSGGFAMGIGIWSMHFVATLALKLPIRVLYDLSLTALSWVFAIGACSAAFIVLRRLTGKHREFLLPGALIGIGIASMHYTGDASMRLSPGIRYDPLLFVASVLIAIGAATAALWIAFHLARQRAVFTNFGAALVMGAAVVGMHFTAVAAAGFHPDSICLATGPRLDEEWMAYTIGGFTFVILTATMLLSAYDARLSSAIAGGAEQLKQANEQLELRVRERTETLANEEARKDAILRAALDCIISMDERGCIAEWNPAAERTFGIVRERALGRSLADLILPERLREAHLTNLARYLTTGEAKLIGKRIEVTALRANGEEFPVEVAITVTQAGEERLFTAHLRDITERKRAEEELRQSRDAARAGSEAKSAFVATMSHEIRTPMNAIIGMLELLSYSKLTADQHEMLVAARTSSRALLTLIDDILDFSKIEVGKLEVHPEPCSVASLVDGVNATFKHVASSKGLLLTRRVDPTLWAAHLIDPSRLRQILTNLVSNAIKFTQDGSVMLEVKVMETSATRQTLRFTVHDSGIGMSEDTQRRLFEPFQQGESDTSRRFGGTGLGLAISRQLVQLMGGTIEITSSAGLGTRVAVTLAAEQASASELRDEAARADDHAPVAVYAPAGTKLLIVDDHPVNLAMLKRQLKVLGLDADSAISGSDALVKWRRARHNLVITDLQMPEMDGYAFARAIRSEQDAANKPMVVAFTANTHSAALDQCKDAGMDDYLTKPTELATLRDKLARWLGSDAGLKPMRADRAADAGRDNPIDRARIEELVGGPEGLAAVLSEIEAGARTDVAALEAALQASDGVAVRSAAHRIKGSALTVGAQRLAAAAVRLEKAPDVLGTPELQGAVQALIAELKVVMAATRPALNVAAG